MKNTCEWLLQQFSPSARPISCVAPILAYKILSFLICAKMHSLIYFKILFLETSLKYISRPTVSLETRWKLFYESLAMYVSSLQKRIQNSKSPYQILVSTTVTAIITMTLNLKKYVFCDDALSIPTM